MENGKGATGTQAVRGLFCPARLAVCGSGMAGDFVRDDTEVFPDGWLQ